MRHGYPIIFPQEQLIGAVMKLLIQLPIDRSAQTGSGSLCSISLEVISVLKKIFGQRARTPRPLPRIGTAFSIVASAYFRTSWSFLSKSSNERTMIVAGKPACSSLRRRQRTQIEPESSPRSGRRQLAHPRHLQATCIHEQFAELFPIRKRLNVRGFTGRKSKMK